MATWESPKPPSSSSSKPEFQGRYDIFLSSRGLDTRKKFSDRLYNALKHKGFQTFRDDGEIERGAVIKSELLKSIGNSRMSVIVLSKNYSNSTACLLELQMILEQCKKTDHFVLPVFYEVDPLDIKEQAKNLDFGEKEVTVEKVKGWSAALKEVASMAGIMISQNQFDGYEARFIDEIVARIKNKPVGEHLVGMDSQTNRIDSWLKDMSTRVGVLVISGMGGIGKTAIAKVLYNSNHGSYDAACFLPNIREAAKGTEGLVHLQRQLLSDILRKKERKVNDVDDGCRRMKYVLTNKRVLLVLDDVDRADQLFALAGRQDWFTPGSKIIITTRLENLMNADEIYEVYRPEKLSVDDSLELFSWHAFGQSHPIHGHMDLSKRFVRRCDGHPLALEVLGCSVRGKSLDAWESALQKLEATSSNTVLERLEISYDSLQDNHDKNLFLDIACFFAGKKKNDTITILEGCDYYALAGIYNLVVRNLLTIVNEKLEMHPLIQDMGKQIVCRESLHPEKRSRILLHLESFNILLEKIGTKKIEGLMVDMNMLPNSKMVVFEANTFEKMYNLRLLKLSGVRLSGTYEAFPRRLRWLYWRGFPSESFPTDFPLEHLVTLDLRYSNLKQVWKGSKALGSLKILNLSHSPKLAKTPDFSRIPNLEKLILKACRRLFEVDESIVKLQRIKLLNLRDCKNLRKLPRNINKVESLVEMDISGCSNLLGAMEELEKMKSLQVLHTRGMDIVHRCLHNGVASQGFSLPMVPKPRIHSSNLKLDGKYDIFLSFRGIDTRTKFTDHLYHALIREGFQTFRDEDDIEWGDAIKPELHRAIMSSRMSVIVISENYTNSKACLFELQTILEQYNKLNHFVLPLFYEVDPSVVKEQSENLHCWKTEVMVEQLKRWSAALKEVLSIAGKVLEPNRHEAKFIEEILDEIKSKLAREHLRVGDHLISMDSRTKSVDSWLKDRSTGVGILLILGMGGIGKTTIAKAVYNSNYGRYEASCFLSNISEVAKGQNGLVLLQRKLLADVLRKEECKVNDVEDGFRRMKDVLGAKKVLLVLDDVDQTDQLFALAVRQDWFSPGSKIIITSRIKNALNAYEIYEVYRPKKFSIDESLELFSWHAFGQKHPSQDHMDLSKRFVQCCDGLPLALQVLGSSIRRNDRFEMESALRKLEATDYTILEVLARGYESLKDNHDKYLFLDIACFFVGKKIHDTIKILEGCNYSALAGINNLVDRNLLRIENGKLEMHQLLHNMGKQIVCRESKHPEERSRIWRHMDSFNILLQKIGTKNIKGLVLDVNMLGNSNLVVFEANTFEEMDDLRLLKLSGVQLSGTYKAFPKRLRWLYWGGFPSEYLPIDFPLENLVALDMRYSNLKRFLTRTKVLGSLKILNLSHSLKLGQTGDFARTPSLEKLVLKACSSLFEVDESIAKLKRLESLNVRDCKNLRKLPRNVGMVESLVEIDISGCSNLMGAIEELEKMKSLQVLKASRMDISCLLTVEVVSLASIWPWDPKPRVQMSLASLPSSLVHLNLSHCNLTDDAFPRDLRKLSKLQHLFLRGNPISSLPNFIKDLKSLQTLDLSWCPKLQQILWPSISLEKLVVTECHSLEKIMSETPTSIKFISNGACLNLYEVQWLFKILPVREVDVELLNNIGFFDLDSMADVEAFIVNYFVWISKKRPIQILYEDNTFTTFFPGREVPHWFSSKNSGSTISFTATVSPHNHFRGLNICLVYTLPDAREWLPYALSVVINSKSSGMKRVYKPSCYGIPEEGGDIVWLSHCNFRPNLFTEGDEVEVSFSITGDGQIKECGVHLLYFEEVRINPIR